MTPDKVPKKIDKYLSTVSSQDAEVDVGFFGGTFTGLKKEEQIAFLDPVQKYIKSGQIKGVRLSTRPDFIDAETLRMLKDLGVRCIELGVQSISDKVLKDSRRGYTSGDVKNASSLIKEYGFILGHQMMLGLPSSDWEAEYLTARAAKDLGAEEVRIYPTLVIKNTELADRWHQTKYVPLDEAEAVERSAKLILYFSSEGIKVIRCGLHASVDLLSGEGMLAGPFHEAFRSKAESRIFYFLLEYIKGSMHSKNKEITLRYNPRDEADFFGFGRENIGIITAICGKAQTERDEKVPKGALSAEVGNKTMIVERSIILSKILKRR